MHRKNGVCLNPATAGLAFSQAWAYDLWIQPVAPDTEEEWREARRGHDQPALF